MLSKAELRGAVMAVGVGVVLVIALITFSPGIPGELLLQTLRFHILAAGAVVAIALMVLGARWRGALLLLIILASGLHSVSFLRDYFGRRGPVYAQTAAEFDFVAFNVLTGNRQSAKLVDAIVADPPDVLLVMETPGIERYRDRLKTVLPYSAGCDVSRTCDISLYSKFPLENAEVRRLPPFGHERLVSAKVEIEGQGVTIVGVHLSKPYFDQASWVELQAIGTYLYTVDGPVILAGDFNSAPWSTPVAALAAKQGLSLGAFPPATWPVEFGVLGVPIDNIFSRGSARIMRIEAGEPLGSNHRPLKARIGLYETP